MEQTVKFSKVAPSNPHDHFTSVCTNSLSPESPRQPVFQKKILRLDSFWRFLGGGPRQHHD